VRTASTSCSPWNSSQVSPASGKAPWIIHSGNSASSDTRFQAKRVNSQPPQMNTSAKASTKTLVTIFSSAAGRGDSSGQTSTSKCEPSRTPTMAPIMIIQTKRKRAISSVQM
jgi:hypothetical protein